MPNLFEIAQAWQAINPRRALGGRHALAGFHYQFNDSLLRFFEPIAANCTPNLAVFDGVSDYATNTADGVYVAQHKLTLRRANYLDALREFLAIDIFLQDKYPAVRTKIRFKIITAGLEGFQLDNPHTLGTDADNSAWQNMCQENRFLGVECSVSTIDCCIRICEA